MYQREILDPFVFQYRDQIAREFEAGATLSYLSDHYGVSVAMIQRIIVYVIGDGRYREISRSHKGWRGKQESVIEPDPPYVPPFKYTIMIKGNRAIRQIAYSTGEPLSIEDNLFVLRCVFLHPGLRSLYIKDWRCVFDPG